MKIRNINKKIKSLWKKNQEESSDRYQEREELKEELEEISKDLDVILKSSVGKMQNYSVKRATLIQNIFLQRKLTQATKGLKFATWILAGATGIFAWVAIMESSNPNYFIQVLQGLGEIFIIFIAIMITISLIWNFVKFFYKKIISEISKKIQSFKN